MLLAIPNFGERISPRIDCAESLKLFNIEDNAVIETETVRILVNNLLERINFIIRLKPDAVICDGISDLFLQKLNENKVKVIPWVHGSVEDVIKSYLSGTLKENRIEN